MARVKSVGDALKVAAAPAVHLAGRFSRSRRLEALALTMDPLNVRSLRHDLAAAGRSTAVFDQVLTALELLASTSESAGQAIKTLVAHSQSQFMQDVVCLLVNDLKHSGYFVEVGVGDGTKISNTHLLETKFGWSGLLVEPCRAFHSQIAAVRKAALETRAAAGVGGQVISFEEFTDEGEFSKVASAADNGVTRSGNTVQYPVTTVTLNTLFNERGAPPNIDYLSVDTEGTELDILSGLDFSKYSVQFISVEHNFRASDVAGLEKLLGPHGYRRILRQVSKFDAWYVHESVNTSKLIV